MVVLGLVQLVQAYPGPRVRIRTLLSWPQMCENQLHPFLSWWLKNIGQMFQSPKCMGSKHHSSQMSEFKTKWIVIQRIAWNSTDLNLYKLTSPLLCFVQARVAYKTVSIIHFKTCSCQSILLFSFSLLGIPIFKDVISLSRVWPFHLKNSWLFCNPKNCGPSKKRHSTCPEIKAKIDINSTRTYKKKMFQ